MSYFASGARNEGSNPSLAIISPKNEDVIKMAKYNQKLDVKERLMTQPRTTLNFEGSLAFVPEAKEKLLKLIATSFVGENKFYMSGEDHVLEIIKMIHSVIKEDPEFVLKLAVYARKELNLRSVTTMLIGEFANSSGVGEVVRARDYVAAAIMRVDDITELLAYQFMRNRIIPKEKGRIPSMIKYGIAKAFNNFDGYQFGKYNRAGEVTLKDALFISHPYPKNEEQQELFNQITNDALPIPETWETYISEHGSNHETWTYIAPKIPIFGLIRNLRNLLEQDVDTDLYLDKLRTPEIIKNSRMLPFRFYMAYRAVQQIPTSPKQREVLDALEDAMDLSSSNINIPGTTAILVDLSGSMTFNYVHRKSQVTCRDIASLFGAIADKMCDKSIIGVFGGSFDTVDVSTRLPTLAKAQQIVNKDVGHATNGYRGIRYLRENNINVDRIIIFSDEQLYNTMGYDYRNNRPDASVQEELFKYRNTVNQEAFLHSIDLNGYPNTMVPPNDPKSNLIAGWSEQILKYIDYFEKGIGSMADAVTQYEVV